MGPCRPIPRLRGRLFAREIAAIGRIRVNTPLLRNPPADTPVNRTAKIPRAPHPIEPP